MSKMSPTFFAMTRSYVQQNSLSGRRGLSAQLWLYLLMAAQVAAILVASIVAKLLYIDLWLGHQQDMLAYILPAIPLGVASCYIFIRMKLFDVATLSLPTIGFGNLLGGLLLSFLFVLGLLYLVKIVDFYSRGWFICWFFVSAILVVALRWQAMQQYRRLCQSGQLQERIAVFGNQNYVNSIQSLLTSQTGQSYDVAPYFNEAAQASDQVRGLPDLLAALDRNEHDKVILAFPPSDHSRIESAAACLSSYSTELLLCTELRYSSNSFHGQRPLGQLRTAVLNTVPAAESDRLIKHMLDYVVAGAGLIVLSPVLIGVAIAIKLDSPGPVFFRQRRYGHNNKVFRIFKFRTMTVTEDGERVAQATRNDPRITRIGRFLRSSSIDELPQLFNVLRGEMSIVGPRPHALAHDDKFAREVELFTSRRRVRPGLTGWAQVNGYRGETKNLDDVIGRMKHDVYYIQNWSIWFDIEIMVRTVLTVFRGAY